MSNLKTGTFETTLLSSLTHMSNLKTGTLETTLLSSLTHMSSLRIGTLETACQMPGITRSVLGLVGPESVYCYWVS